MRPRPDLDVSHPFREVIKRLYSAYFYVWRGFSHGLELLLGSEKGTFGYAGIPEWLGDTDYLLRTSQRIPTVLQQVYNTIEDPVFQQDNAPVHKAKTVIAWFEENNIDLEDHPLVSPDLNPIEYVRTELKKRLHHQYPDIIDTPGRPDKVKERLAEVLPLVWDTIPEELFDKLWQSMPNRVNVVIEAKGWYTKY